MDRKTISFECEYIGIGDNGYGRELGYDVSSEGTTLPELIENARVWSHNEDGLSIREQGDVYSTRFHAEALAVIRTHFEREHGKITDAEMNAAIEVAFPSDPHFHKTVSDERGGK